MWAPQTRWSRGAWAAAAAWLAAASVARADIYQWEYMVAGNPASGKRASATLTVDGLGTFAGPGANLGWRGRSSQHGTAYLDGATLIAADFEEANLSNATLMGANLTGAGFRRTTLTGVDLTGANIAGAGFYDVTSRGFTSAQFYSTTTYASGDLTGIALENNNLSGWNFAGKNLTGASLYGSNVTGANFAGANIRGAILGDATAGALTQAQFESTASYQSGDLTGINVRTNTMAGWNFAGKNLSHATFGYSITVAATLTGAQFAGATIRGAQFYGTVAKGFTEAQLASTASYQSGDLTGVRLGNNSLAGWNFSNQNLTDARFLTANLTGTNFAGATIRGASFYNTTDKGFTRTQLESTASFQAGDLQGVDLGGGNDLSGWNLAGMDLTNAGMTGTLTGANLTGATIRGVDFSFGVASRGFTPAMLASTASYAEHDLRGINLRFSRLAGFDFSNQDLTGVNFNESGLGGVSFDGAIIRDVDFIHTTTRQFQEHLDFQAAQLYSTASYAAHDLRGVRLGQNNLAGWSFAGQDLTGASFFAADITGCDFTGATLEGAGFEYYPGLSVAQMYSTASYAAKNFRGVNFSQNALAGRDLAGIDFSEGTFQFTDFSGANLEGANFTNAYLFLAAVNSANMRGVDARGSFSLDASAAIADNMIHGNGEVLGLNLTGGQRLVVRDYDGDPESRSVAGPGISELPAVTEMRPATNVLPPIAIQVRQQLVMDATSELELRLEADAWDSVIRFDAGIQVTLGGTLALGFAAGVDPASQAGRTFRIFDWTGVSPTGQLTVPDAQLWDLADLYTDGEATYLGETFAEADFDKSGTVDGTDLALWRAGFGKTGDAERLDGDADADLDVDGVDFLRWQRQFGDGGAATASLHAVPEADTLGLAVGAALACCAARSSATFRRRRATPGIKAPSPRSGR